jgi:hypothetical protein
MTFTVSRQTHDKLRHAQDLLRHQIPNGDPAVTIDRPKRQHRAAFRRRCGARSGGATRGGAPSLVPRGGVVSKDSSSTTTSSRTQPAARERAWSDRGVRPGSDWGQTGVRAL